MPSNRNLFRPRSASTSDGGIFADRSCGWSPERTVALPMPRLWVPDPQDDGHHRALDVARRSGEVQLHDRPQGLGGRTPAGVTPGPRPAPAGTHAPARPLPRGAKRSRVTSSGREDAVLFSPAGLGRRRTLGRHSSWQSRQSFRLRSGSSLPAAQHSSIVECPHAGHGCSLSRIGSGGGSAWASAPFSRPDGRRTLRRDAPFIWTSVASRRSPSGIVDCLPYTFPKH